MNAFVHVMASRESTTPGRMQERDRIVHNWSFRDGSPAERAPSAGYRPPSTLPSIFPEGWCRGVEKGGGVRGGKCSPLSVDIPCSVPPCKPQKMLRIFHFPCFTPQATNYSAIIDELTTTFLVTSICSENGAGSNGRDTTSESVRAR